MSAATNGLASGDSAPLVVTMKEAARLLCLSLSTVKKMVASRELRSMRVGRRVLVPRKALEEFTRRDHATV